MRNSLILFLLPLLFNSCHLLVQDEFEEFTSYPVLNGVLQADSTFKIHVSISSNLTDSTQGYVENAQVIIIDETQGQSDTLHYLSEGWYVSLKRVIAGNSYTCRADIPDFPALSASTTVPFPTSIDSVIFTKLAGWNENGAEISAVQFKIRNDVVAKKFWSINMVIKGFRREYDPVTRNYNYVMTESYGYINLKPEQDSVLLAEAEPLKVISNSKMKSDYWWKFYTRAFYTSLGKNDTVLLELKSIDESSYKFQKQFFIYQEANQTKIGKSPQRYSLYSNVSNGMGLFTGESVCRCKIAYNQEIERN
jgi:hypothetical protein